MICAVSHITRVLIKGSDNVYMIVKEPVNRPLWTRCFKAISRKKLINDFHKYFAECENRDINQCIVDYALEKGIVKQ